MRALVPWFLVASLDTFAAAARTKEYQGHRDRLEADIIPDLQLYPRDMEGPQELTPAQRDLLHGRVARCYDPRANGDYSDVQWQQALDQYMREEVSKGLKKVPRVVVTGMDMWGSHLPARYMPHHWISAIIPDVDASPSSHCFDFSYDAASADPNGCRFFEKSFRPLQRLFGCLNSALEHSQSWLAWQEVMDADAPEVTVTLALPGTTAKLRLRHAKWNEKTVVHEDFRVTRECHPSANNPGNIPDMVCQAENAELVDVVRECDTEYLGGALEAFGSLSVKCRKVLSGTDRNLQSLLQDRRLVGADEGDDLQGQVGVARNAKEAHQAVKRGAIALILFDDSELGLPEDLVTFFVVDPGQRQHRIPTGATITRYFVETPEDWPGDALDFSDEVRHFNSGENARWLSTRHRIYEMIKAVSQESLDVEAPEVLRRVRAALRRTVTQTADSQLEQIDPSTEQNILQCYDLPVATALRISSSARHLHEASQCLPLMWDKAQMAPPLPQVFDGNIHFQYWPDIEALDTFQVHPVCARLSLAFMASEMSKAPYPNITEGKWWWTALSAPGALWDSAFKANPWWLKNHLLDYCLHPDTAVCTSFTVCWAMLLRHVTKLIHPFCDEKARAFPEMPVSEEFLEKLEG